MKMIKMRELRGSQLERLAQDEALVGITSNRVLVAVLVPMTEAWLEHLVDFNKTRIQQNILEGELEAANGELVTLEEAMEATSRESSVACVPLPCGAVPVASSALNRLATGMGSLVSRLCDPSGSKEYGMPADSFTTRTIRIGDVSGLAISEAAQEGCVLALTNERVLIGLLLPVKERLVQHLIQENLSRVYQSIDRGEREAAVGRFVTLDEAAGTDLPEDSSSRSIRHALNN